MTEEKILVVPAAGLWKQMPYTQKGLITESAEELNGVVARSGVFINRSEAENDPAYKQIIPYAVVRAPRCLPVIAAQEYSGRASPAP